MKNSSAQADTQSSRRLQTSELGERLCRRLTEPVGVIDTSYARQKRACLVEWLDNRLRLINQIQIRYAIPSDGDGNGQQLVMHEPSTEQANIYSTTVERFATPAAFMAPAAESLSSDSIFQPLSSTTAAQLSKAEMPATQTSTHSADPFLPEGKFRVSRRPVPIDLSPVTPAPQSPPLPSTVAQARPDEAVPEPADKFRGARKMKTPGQTPGAVASAIDPPATVAKIIQAAPVDSAQPATLPLARPQASLELSEDPPVEQPDQSSASQLIERIVAGVGKRDPEVANQRESDVAGDSYVASERKSAAAVEIKEVSSAQARPEIVWRQSDDVPRAAHIANEPGGNPQARSARQVDRPAHQSQQPDQATAPVTARNRGGEIGIEQISPQVMRTISEKVMHHISRDLAIELERRGLRKWR